MNSHGDLLYVDQTAQIFDKENFFFNMKLLLPKAPGGKYEMISPRKDKLKLALAISPECIGRTRKILANFFKLQPFPP